VEITHTSDPKPSKVTHELASVNRRQRADPSMKISRERYPAIEQVRKSYAQVRHPSDPGQVSATPGTTLCPRLSEREHRFISFH